MTADSVQHRPGDEIDGTVYRSCGQGDYGTPGHPPLSAASERAEVNGKCPACGSGGLFVGSGGYLTCPWAECPNPSAPHDALTFTRQSRAEIQAEALMDFRKGFGRRFGFQDPYGHFDPGTVSALHRQVEGLLDAEAQRIREGGEHG